MDVCGVGGGGSGLEDVMTIRCRFSYDFGCMNKVAAEDSSHIDLWALSHKVQGQKSLEKGVKLIKIVITESEITWLGPINKFFIFF